MTDSQIIELFQLGYSALFALGFFIALFLVFLFVFIKSLSR